MREAKIGDFTLVWNGERSGHPVGLTRDQHAALQAFVAAMSKSDPVTVVKSVRIIHEEQAMTAAIILFLSTWIVSYQKEAKWTQKLTPRQKDRASSIIGFLYLCVFVSVYYFKDKL